MRTKILIQGTIIRAAYGVFALLLPKYLFASIGMKDVDTDARYLNRLFGGRDLLVAGDTLLDVRAGNTSRAVVKNLICEATDTISLVEELRERGKLERSLIVGVAFNVVGYATWLRALFAADPAIEAPAVDAE